MPVPKDLSPLQQRYVDARLAGQTKAQAYATAGYAMAGGNKGRVKACDLERVPKVKAAIEAGLARARARSDWTREHMLETLREIAEDRTAPKAARTGAIAQASKMLGLDAPQKVENSGEMVIRWQS